jgi:hypothetical protein
MDAVDMVLSCWVAVAGLLLFEDQAGFLSARLNFYDRDLASAKKEASTRLYTTTTNATGAKTRCLCSSSQTTSLKTSPAA